MSTWSLSNFPTAFKWWDNSLTWDPTQHSAASSNGSHTLCLCLCLRNAFCKGFQCGFSWGSKNDSVAWELPVQWPSKHTGTIVGAMSMGWGKEESKAKQAVSAALPHSSGKSCFTFSSGECYFQPSPEFHLPYLWILFGFSWFYLQHLVNKLPLTMLVIIFLIFKSCRYEALIAKTK